MKKLLCTAFILLFSLVSFADDVADLELAVANGRVDLVKQLLEEKSVDPNKIGYFNLSGASKEIQHLLFNNKTPLDPDKFLSAALSTSYSYEAGKKQQTDSIRILIEKYGANPNNINSFGFLPSFDTSLALLCNKNLPLNPNKFLGLILNISRESYGFEKSAELVKLALGEPYNADPNEIDSFTKEFSPSLELYELLLKNKKYPLDMNKFYDLVCGHSSREVVESLLDKKWLDTNKLLKGISLETLPDYGDEPKDINVQEYIDAHIKQEKERINELLILLLSKGASDQNIERFFELPSIAEAELFISKGLTSQKLLDLVLSYQIENYEQALKQTDLVDFAVKKGADLKQIYETNPEMECVPYCRFNQVYLMDRLALMLGNSQIDLKPSIVEEIKNKKGLCLGLTTVWLHSKWFKFTQQNQSEYSDSLFTNPTRALMVWNSKDKLDAESASVLQKFCSAVSLFQSPGDDISGGSQVNIEQSMAKSVKMGWSDERIKSIKKVYTIVSSFNLEQLISLLKEVIHEDELAYVIHPGHATGLIKHGETYYFYDPNNNKGEHVSNSVEETAKAIFDVFKSISENRAIGIMIYSDKNSNNYPALTTFLNGACGATATKDTFETSSKLAVEVGCLESLKFFIERWSKVSQEANLGAFGEALLYMASWYDHPNIVKELLEKGVNPAQSTNNQARMREENKATKKSIENFSCLHKTSKEGYVEVVKELLGYKGKIDLDTKDSDGKTALNYAEEKSDESHREIARLLKAYKDW